MLQCCGCNHTFVEKRYSDSESYSYIDHGNGEHEPVADETITVWPALSKRKYPDWLDDFGIDAPDTGRLGTAMLELYGALNNDLNVLAGIGLRTCFDVASELLNGDPESSFAAKLGGLVTRGHIGVRDKDRLEALVDAGSASAHRGWKPDAQALNVMTEILEHFVYEAFVAPHRRAKLDAKVLEMKKSVPPRRKGTKGKAAAGKDQ